MNHNVKPKVAVTGANGFLGAALINKLSEQGYQGYALSRKPLKSPHCFTDCLITDINADTDYTGCLIDVDCIIHCAARVHIPTKQSTLTEFRQTNVAGSLNLARQAHKQGVKRFIFISSVKAMGEETQTDMVYTYQSIPVPVDPYGLSKLEAEQALQDFTAQVGMELVIIRPPLIYGVGVKANFLQLLRCVDKGIPLPLGAIHNQRSFLALDNMIDLIISCISHPQAANQLFLVSDDCDLSTTELLHLIANALGKRPKLIPLPMTWIDMGGRWLNQRTITQRLCGSLVLDISHTRQTLNWLPPVSTEAAMIKTVAGYRQNEA